MFRSVLCRFRRPRAASETILWMAHVTFEVYNTFLDASPLAVCSLIPIFLTISEGCSPGSSRNIDPIRMRNVRSELVLNTYCQASRWGPAPSGRHTRFLF